MCPGLRNRAKPLRGSCFGCPGAVRHARNALLHNDSRKQRRLCCCSKQSRHYTMIRLFWHQKTLVSEVRWRRKVTQRSSAPGSSLRVAFFHNDGFAGHDARDSASRAAELRPSIAPHFYTMMRSATAWPQWQMGRFHNAPCGPDPCPYGHAIVQGGSSYRSTR